MGRTGAPLRRRLRDGHPTDGRDASPVEPDVEPGRRPGIPGVVDEHWGIIARTAGPRNAAEQAHLAARHALHDVAAAQRVFDGAGDGVGVQVVLEGGTTRGWGVSLLPRRSPQSPDAGPQVRHQGQRDRENVGGEQKIRHD